MPLQGFKPYPEQEFLTTAQVAAELNLSPRTVRKLCESRKIQFRQITPRRIEIRRDWLDAYLEKQTIEPEEN